MTDKKHPRIKECHLVLCY